MPARPHPAHRPRNQSYVKDGVPFAKLMYLILEAGSGSNYSFLRAHVNGKEVRRVDLPERINLGTRQWKPLSLGVDEDGKNKGAFLFLELGVWSLTLTKEEIEKLTVNARAFYKV
jgi:hypothetical protein